MGEQVPAVGVPDAEEQLSNYGSARSSYDSSLNKNLGDPMTRNRSTLKSQKITPEDFDARRRWFVQRYPGTDIAARVEGDRISELFEAGAWDLLPGAAAETIDKYPALGLVRAKLLYLLVRVINNKEAPDAARKACMEVLLSRVQNAPAMLAMTSNYLSQNTSLTTEQQYSLAAKGAGIAGHSARVRDFLWRFISKHAAESPVEGRKLVEEFLQHYPDESLSSLEAQELLLTIQTGDASAAEKLKSLRAGKAATTAAVKNLCSQADVAAEKNDFKGVEEAFRLLSKQPVWSTDIPWWAKFVATNSGDLPLPLMAMAVKIVPPGARGDELASAILSNEALCYDAEGVNLVLLALDKYSDDIQRHGAPLRSRLLRMRVPLVDPQLKLAAYQKAADISLRLDMKDAAADFLFEVGKSIATNDHEAALKLLGQAATLAPGTDASVNATWLVALMDKKMEIVAPLVARNTLPGTGSEPPNITLPKLLAKDQGDVVLNNGIYSLRSQPKGMNLANWKARSGTPSKSDTQWEPKSLPASLIIPLDQTATLKSLFLKFSSPAKFDVTLLDANGRALSRYARDWPLWDPFDLQTTWPGPEEKIDLPPVAGTCFLRVDFYEAMTDRPVLEMVEALATPFVADGTCRLDPQDLPPGTKSLTINWKAQNPERSAVYDIGSETVYPYPITRWFRPWTKKVMRDNLGIEFRGSSANLSIAGGPGRLLWSLNGAPKEHFEQAEVIARNVTTDVPVQNMEGNSRRHFLRLTKEWVAGRSGTSFSKLAVLDRGSAGVRIRFGDGKTWDEWQGPYYADGAIQIAAKSQARQYQIEVALDARALLAQETPTLANLTVAPALNEAARQASPQSLDVNMFPERLAEVVESLAQRKVTVVYPKAGTRAEYELARRIAERAGVHLISDDVGLNLNNEYYGPVLAVGTPRDNRFTRQLIGMCGVWNDPEFLNNRNGVIGKVDDIDKNTYFFVAGDSPEAVEKAGERLLSKIPQYTAGNQPFHVFGSNTLTVIYPWQSGFAHPEVKELGLRLAVNDRRSQQFGLTTNRELSSLEVTVSELKGADGRILPAPQIRTLGGYEWIPFFGDLRLPNFLVDKPSLPVPAYTSLGFWITARTTPDTKPGIYRGAVKIQSGSFAQTVPISIEVDPFKLPNFPRIDTFSYASLPWWYKPETKAFDGALRELAENESEKRVNTVAPKMLVDWKVGENVTPARYSVAAADTQPAQLKWLEYTTSDKGVADGQALFIEFADTIKPVEIGGGFFTDGSEIETTALAKSVTKFSPQKPLAVKNWSVVRVPTNAVESKLFCFRSGDGKAFRVGSIRAFLGKGNPIVSFDFSKTLHQMDIFDEVYKRAGLQLPNFHLHMANILGPQVTQNLYGIGHWHYGGGAVATDFVRQFKDRLKATGRDERTILKVGDEPRTLKEWAEVAAPYKKGGMRVMTAHYSGRPDVKDAVGVMNPWCPNYEHDLFDPVIRAQQKAGDKVWWYQCGVPPTRLTGKLADNLPVYWLTAKWNLDGVANYAALEAKESGGEGSPIPFRYDHGMGYRMNYLLDGRLLDTNRRELEAEGIKDYTLIEFIRDGIARMKKEGRGAEATPLEEKLNAVIHRTVPDKRGYPTSPEPWISARNQLYDLATQTVK